MATTIIRVSRQKTEELKGMISEGLNIFGRAMSLAEQMCEDSEMGERGGGYDNRGGYGQRDMDDPYRERMDGMGERMGMRMDGMGERMGMREESMGERMGMPQSPYEYSERRGVRGTGRYSRF